MKSEGRSAKFWIWTITPSSEVWVVLFDFPAAPGFEHQIHLSSTWGYNRKRSFSWHQ